MSEPITTQEERDEATRKLLRGLAHDTFMLGVDWVLDMILFSEVEGQEGNQRAGGKAMAAAMKARDIIPGWPRSRSTMTVVAADEAIERLRDRVTGLANHLWQPGLTNRQVMDREHLRVCLRAELLNASIYHDMQQFRQNAWFEAWRNPDAEEILIANLAARRLLEAPAGFALRVKFRRPQDSKPSSLLYVPK